MKLLIFSDLHLEFGYDFQLPPETEGDVLLLAGDICNLREKHTLQNLIHDVWTKPVLYVPGNHEFYTSTPVAQEIRELRSWLAEHLPNVKLLIDEPVTIDGVNFFGGTMWTDFWGANAMAMSYAQHNMTDYRLIRTSKGPLLPEDTVMWHNTFRAELDRWCHSHREGPHVVITHTAPIAAQDTKYRGSPLQAAFVSRDMQGVIENNRFIDLWVYGHTHECDDQKVGDTRVVSNQQGYLRPDGSPEDPKFDPKGMGIEI